MPPKKKSGKKKKGKKSGRKSATGHPTEREKLSELSKEYYHIQLRDLENRLGRFVYSSDIKLQIGGTQDATQ